VLSGVLSATGVDRFLTEQGIDLRTLLLFSAAVGFTGSLVSLLLSKPMAKWSTRARPITGGEGAAERWLVETVAELSRHAGVTMPEVAVYAGAPNAFATGAFKNGALVAVSTELLESMDRQQLEAVLGHEMSHVANGDMVTLTLIQGVLNTFVFFLSRVVGFIVDRVLLKNERGYGIGYMLTTFVAQIVLGILASVIVMAFSRWREFRADAGGAALAGREKMIAALERLKLNQEQSQLPAQISAFGISGGGGLMRLFMSHPPLEERIAALRTAAQPERVSPVRRA